MQQFHIEIKQDAVLTESAWPEEQRKAGKIQANASETGRNTKRPLVNPTLLR